MENKDVPMSDELWSYALQVAKGQEPAQDAEMLQADVYGRGKLDWV